MSHLADVSVRVKEMHWRHTVESTASPTVHLYIQSIVGIICHSRPFFFFYFVTFEHFSTQNALVCTRLTVPLLVGFKILPKL